MAIKRYYATKDNTITNAFKANLETRGVSGNMGQSDILEVFSIYAQANTSSSELSRVLIEFNTDAINTDRTAGIIPASGSVSFFLRMYNARHSQTTPKDFTIITTAVSQSWDEGLGLDMENYSDEDASSWISASEGTAWTSQGGDYITGSDSAPLEYTFTQDFDTGFEDLEIDVSHLVEDWISGDLDNYGFGVHLTSSDETASNSYYTKKFFARGSQYFHKRPVVEARWDSSKKDNRGDFYLSSSLVPASDNLMNLYLYNVVRGQLTDIPAVGTDEMEVSIYSGSTTPTGDKLYLPIGGGVVGTEDVSITASHVETGIYSCSFAYASSSITKIFDVWHSGSVEYHTGSGVDVQTFDSKDYNFDQRYVSKIINLRTNYSTEETARFRLFVRPKNFQPNIYTVASQEIENTIVDNVYYQVKRSSDGLPVIEYGTGSLNHTRLSYDVSGSYFDLDIGMLEAENSYQIKFVYLINGSYVEQPETFRFNVI
jgi:hypothetical protein